MASESPSAQQQQRANVELYVRSKWIKASLALEDENLFIEYAHTKRDQQTPTPVPFNAPTTNSNSNEETTPNNNNASTNNETPDTITSQKRTVKIVKPDNTGLGKSTFPCSVILHRFSSRK